MRSRSEGQGGISALQTSRDDALFSTIDAFFIYSTHSYAPLSNACRQSSSLVLVILITMTEKSATRPGAASDKNTAVKSKTGDAGSDARAKDSLASAAAKSETVGSTSHSSPRKRRKVNHGKLLLRPLRARYLPFAQQGSGRCRSVSGSQCDREIFR